MGVRVRLLIEAADRRRLSSSALLNGGFESSRPEILLPVEAAHRLYGVYPKGTHVIPVEVATGAAALLEVPEALSVTVVTQDRRGPRTRCRVLVSDGADEILLSDAAIDAVGVKVESFREVTWRFAREKRVRSSARRRVFRRP